MTQSDESSPEDFDDSASDTSDDSIFLPPDKIKLAEIGYNDHPPIAALTTDTMMTKFGNEYQIECENRKAAGEDGFLDLFMSLALETRIEIYKFYFAGSVLTHREVDDSYTSYIRAAERTFGFQKPRRRKKRPPVRHGKTDISCRHKKPDLSILRLSPQLRNEALPYAFDYVTLHTNLPFYSPYPMESTEKSLRHLSYNTLQHLAFSIVDVGNMNKRLPRQLVGIQKFPDVPMFPNLKTITIWDCSTKTGSDTDTENQKILGRDNHLIRVFDTGAIRRIYQYCCTQSITLRIQFMFSSTKVLGPRSYVVEQ